MAFLFAGCYGGSKATLENVIEHSLDDAISRPIVSSAGYQYPEGLKRLGGGSTWTPELMELFLASPKNFAPGTKMEFQGLLSTEDRKALVSYLKQKL